MNILSICLTAVETGELNQREPVLWINRAISYVSKPSTMSSIPVEHRLKKKKMNKANKLYSVIYALH